MNSYKRLEDDPIVDKPQINNPTKYMEIFPPYEQQKSNYDVTGKFKKPAFLVTDMTSTFINMQKSFQYVGDNSTFQKRITTILVIQWISFSFMVNSMAYFFRTPNFQCRLPLSDIWISCSQSIACIFKDSNFMRMNFDNGSFLNYRQASIVQQFGLICDNKDYAPLAQSLFFLGGFISGYLLGYISERIGRRSTLLIVIVASITSILISALAPSFEIFLIGYFFTGFSLFGYETSVYIYIGEISAIRFRTISINMLTMVFVGSPIFLPLLALIPSWRYAFILFAFLLILTIPFAYNCFLQSPRFLLSKKCYKQARKIFKQISEKNQRPPYQFYLLEEIDAQNEKFMKYKAIQTTISDFAIKKLTTSNAKTYNYLDLFKFNSLRRMTLILMVLWMFRFFLYYGLNLALQSIVKSALVLTLAIAIGAILQVLGTFGLSIMTLFCKKTASKLEIIKMSLLVISCATLIMWFLQIDINCKIIPISSEDEVCLTIILMVLLVLVIKFFNTVFFSSLIVYYSQVFPTPVRSLGCGFTLTFGRLGTIIVPFYINYMKVSFPTKNALSFLVPFGFLTFLLCWLMPQKGMKQHIQQQQQEQQNVFVLRPMNTESAP